MSDYPDPHGFDLPDAPVSTIRRLGTSTENTPAAWTRRAQSAREPWTACGWSRESQATRFQVILGSLGIGPYCSLLDYGCGTGDFYGALNEYASRRYLGWEIDYLGFDWSLGMTERARREHLDAEFTTMLRDGDTWDYVVCCGTFNLKDNWSKAQTWALMRMLWNRCKVAMAVSLYAGSDPACIRYVPSEVATTAGVLSQKFSLERGYLPNDLLVVLRR